jgi:hypothetical protein
MVIPAEAGIQGITEKYWIPVPRLLTSRAGFTGMTAPKCIMPVIASGAKQSPAILRLPRRRNAPRNDKIKGGHTGPPLQKIICVFYCLIEISRFRRSFFVALFALTDIYYIEFSVDSADISM